MGVESILNKDHWIPLSISWSYLTSVFDIRKILIVDAQMKSSYRR